MANAKPKKEFLLPSKTDRAFVSFPHEIYENLKQILQKKKFSVVWVVRNGAEKYVADRWPLLEQR